MTAHQGSITANLVNIMNARSITAQQYAGADISTDHECMALYFPGLLVIPSLKLSDKGLFDGERFCFTALAV